MADPDPLPPTEFPDTLPPSVAEDARLGHRNLIAESRASTTWCRRGSFEEHDGILTFAGGSWLPVNCNGAFRTDDSVPATELIARADDFFTRRKRGFTIKVRDSGEDRDVESVCLAEGLVALGDPDPEMICRGPFGDIAPPAGVTLRTVVDEQGVADFIAVNTDAYAIYGMPADVLADCFDQPDAVLADENVVMVMAYRDEVPLAAAMTFMSDGIASLQWVGTVAAARQLGLGRVITQLATNVAFEHGAATCTLQASEMGAPVYAKLGYETIYRYQNYCRWGPVAP
jgi:hypothetical protein